MNTQWNKPTLLGDHKQESIETYLNKIDHGIKLFDQLNKLPEIRVTRDPILQYNYSNPAWHLQKIKLFKSRTINRR